MGGKLEHLGMGVHRMNKQITDQIQTQQQRMERKRMQSKPVQNQQSSHNPVHMKEKKKQTKDAIKGKLKCLLLNARSIINKKEELEAVAYEKKTVMLENLTNRQDTDTVWCKYEDINIGVCYNTTANSIEQEEPLLELIKEACQSSRETIITGDFNHETIDWDLIEANAEGQKFLDVTEDLFLTQHVKEATRANNILDLILSTNHNQIRNVIVTEKLGSSDHNIIEFEIITKGQPTHWKTKYRDYRKADFDKIRYDIQSEEYTKDDNADTQELWNNLKDKLNDVTERNIPLKERTMGKQPKPMWWNRKIKRLRKNRLKWWNRYKESNREEHEDIYLHYQKEVNKEIRRSKRKLEKRLGENIKSDRKGFFKYARSKMKVKESVGPIADEHGHLIKDEKQMTKVFSEFFKSVFT